MNRRKTVKGEINRFCDTTGLDGFEYAKEAHCLEERFLWIISTTLFFALMSLFLYYQFVTYNESPTVTSVQLQYPSSLELPDQTVCVQINISAFTEKTVAFKRLISNAGYVSNFIRNLPSADFDKDFNRTLNGLDQDCWVGCDYSSTFMTWLVLTVNYIAETVRVENYLQPASSNLSFMDIRKIVAPDKARSYVGATNPIEKHIRVLMTTWHISFTDVIKVVGAAMCRIIDIRLQKGSLSIANGIYQNSTYTFPCTVDRITWIGAVPVFGGTKDVLCVSMANLNEFNFTSRMDSVKLIAAPLQLYNTKDWLELEKVRSYGIYIKPGGERVFSLDFDSRNLLRIPAHSLSHVPMEISAVYQAYPAKRQCVDSSLAVSECLSRCRVEAFLRLCGCFPMSQFSIEYLVDNKTDICTISRLTNTSAVGPECLQLTRSNSNNAECDEQCKPPCVVKLFRFYRVPYRRSMLKITKNESNGFLEPGGDVLQPFTKAVFNFQRFSYPLYVEEWQKTLIDMIADVGNISGVWLGASVLALVHIFVYTVVSILDCILVHKVSSLPNNNTFLLCHKDKQRNLSRSRRLNNAFNDIKNDLDRIMDTVVAETAALKNEVEKV